MTDIELRIIGRQVMQQAYQQEELLLQLRKHEQEVAKLRSLLTKKQLEKLSCLNGPGS